MRWIAIDRIFMREAIILPLTDIHIGGFTSFLGLV